jgi:hypothetical protein
MSGYHISFPSLGYIENGISLRARRLDSDPLTGFVRQSGPEGPPRWAALARRACSILLSAKAAWQDYFDYIGVTCPSARST